MATQSLRLRSLPILFTLVMPAAALAQPGPDGFDWATIGAPGNAPYERIDQSNGRWVRGRGSVNYGYKLTRGEVSTAQWLEFYNAASMRETPIPFVGFIDRPVYWGATRDETYQGPGVRFRLISAESGQWPCTGMTWRTAAVFANWLTNDKSTDAAAFASGAYDVSTFGDANGVFTDQPRHSPGARYWIPTLDERLKATHYDPNKFGTGQGGWWLYPNGSDTPMTYGPPGQGQANAGFVLPNHREHEIPLGAYADQITPWGLLDAAGANREFLEDILYIERFAYRTRFTTGSYFGIGGVNNDGATDRADIVGDTFPDVYSTNLGLRLASIPSVPSAVTMVAFAGASCLRRRRAL